MGNNTERLEAELALAKLSDKYDEAVEAYREHPTPANKKKYNGLAREVSDARMDFRAKHRVSPDGAGNGTAKLDTVQAGTTVKGDS